MLMFLKRPRPWLACVVLVGATGCDATSPPASPVVAIDSDEGRKARAEDEAERALRKQMEAKALSRKKNLKLPEDG
ncbi:hypothetical protein [Paludisphaera soli]|uniref:hypothetical protein n=1 Tax=Paludisphaera soli TaxID=2712865 RepID=UPI0013EB0CA4|nr:hypothetical protein [Paludisphaera soli]